MFGFLKLVRSLLVIIDIATQSITRRVLHDPLVAKSSRVMKKVRMMHMRTHKHIYNRHESCTGVYETQ